MSQGRATPYHPGTNTLAIPLREPVCTMHHAFLCVQQRALHAFPLERWRQQGPDGSAHGACPAPLQEFPPRGTHDRCASGEREE
jgi:hypothetical protein